MVKRKRDAAAEVLASRSSPINRPAEEKAAVPTTEDGAPHATIQIVAGSYERVLHGITAELSQPSNAKCKEESRFSDTFLFNAHTSSIRCIALSPVSTTDINQKVILASGSTDERINLYHLSSRPPPRNQQNRLGPSLTGNAVSENPKNRELGSLVHHSGSVTSLCFPTRSKLLSSAEDSTIAVIRSRDWTVLSTIKAPIPKAHGRPSGDTAPPGGVPAGVTDFALHPSMKLMLTVGKGEKCMRLWNLVTGKKAGVLNFGKEILQGVGEGRWGSGEGRRVRWNHNGDEFIVGFERGAVAFGLDSKPKYRILPSPLTKIHQIRYLNLPLQSDEEDTLGILVVSTEDGRVLFYSTVPEETYGASSASSQEQIPNCRLVGQLGGRSAGLSGRIKDFEILTIPTENQKLKEPSIIVITGSSDGAIRVWRILISELRSSLASARSKGQGGNLIQETYAEGPNPASKNCSPLEQVGVLMGTYETGNRITCLAAFVMSGRVDESDDKSVGADGADEDEDGKSATITEDSDSDSK